MISILHVMRDIDALIRHGAELESVTIELLNENCSFVNTYQLFVEEFEIFCKNCKRPSTSLIVAEVVYMKRNFTKCRQENSMNLQYVTLVKCAFVIKRKQWTRIRYHSSRIVPIFEKDFYQNKRITRIRECSICFIHELKILFAYLHRLHSKFIKLDIVFNNYCKSIIYKNFSAQSSQTVNNHLQNNSNKQALKQQISLEYAGRKHQHAKPV